MKTPLSILHLEDNSVDADFMATMLQEDGIECEVRCVRSRAEYERQLDRSRFDLIVSDYSLPSFDGGEALRLARALAPGTPFIFVSGTIGEEVAIESLKNGAVDYVLKNRLSRFPAAVRRAVEDAERSAERAQLQRELIRRDELFHQITDNVDDLIAVLDLTGRRIFSSPSYRRILVAPCELEGTDSFAEVHEEDRERIRGVFAQTVATGVGQRAEYRLQARDGSFRSIESQGSVIRDVDGRITNVVVVSRDITEWKQIEARLREQAELLDKAQDAIFTRDLDQKVTYWNRGAERLYGWTQHEIVGEKASDLFYRQDPPGREDIWKAVLERGEWTGELRQITKDGRKIVVISRRTLLRNPAGEPVAVMNIDTDVTERKEMEEKLLRSQRLESIGALAGGIAHDLNNLLAPILMVAEVLRDEAHNDTDRHLLETVKASAMRGADLVKQILAFAHGTTDEPMVIQIRHLIKDMTKLMEETFPRSIRIRRELASDLWPVRGDPTQLHQVLLNLCINARDAMPDGGPLSIVARNVQASGSGAEYPRVMLEVTDGGSGVVPEIRDKIFQPFFTTKGTGKGTGLGLSTVAGIVKKHGGEITLTSDVGRGTTFRVFLPACVDASEAAQKQDLVRPPKGNGQHILLVDDEQAILLMTQATLEAFNYRVTVARDGLEALSLFRQQPASFDLVITDSMMPLMDGSNLIRYLHRLDHRVKVISISGTAGATEIMADSKPVVASLRKPYEGSQLLMLIGNVLGDRVAGHL